MNASAASPHSAAQPAPIRNISDTALWAAAYRAHETDRSDALFRDPFARALAGDRGFQALAAMPGSTRYSWTWVTRTWLFDYFLNDRLKHGVDMVINLAAGLDARPYRMDLPKTLKWVEIDLPELLNYKQEILKDAQPRCALERIPLDLADEAARRDVFARLGGEARTALIITEGLLIYLTPEQVAALARDLAAQQSFKFWINDIASPGLLDMLQRNIGKPLGAAGAPLKFGPPEGPAFFEPHGWRTIDVRGLLKSAARLKRLPFFLRLLAMLPESKTPGKRPWSGDLPADEELIQFAAFGRS